VKPEVSIVVANGVPLSLKVAFIKRLRFLTPNFAAFKLFNMILKTSFEVSIDVEKLLAVQPVPLKSAGEIVPDPISAVDVICIPYLFGMVTISESRIIS